MYIFKVALYCTLWTLWSVQGDSEFLLSEGSIQANLQKQREKSVLNQIYEGI